MVAPGLIQALTIKTQMQLAALAEAAP
jgi:hypothetical protein